MPATMNQFARALLRTAATAALLSPAAAFAQAAPQADATAETPGTDIVVIGTRRTDRSVTDSASPVDVIGASELTSQGTANVVDAVRNVIPSFFVGQNTISDASTFVRSPSLRGLPGDQVLVQLNGKRYNRSSLVQVYVGGDTGLSFGAQAPDISAIPAIGVRNLQVLRDGATAQYGSDAIAGVLNFQLRNDTGFGVQARYGQNYDNGGDGGSRNIAAYAGFEVGSILHVNLAGEYFDDDGTSRGATRPVALIFAQQNPTLASQLPNFPGPVQIWGSSPTDGYKALVNVSLDVTDNSELYFFGNLAHSEGNQSFNYRSPISATGLAVNDGSGTPATRSPGRNTAFSHPIYLTPCPTGNATCPAGAFVRDTNVYNFSTLYPAGFTPRFLGVTDEIYGAVGWRGELSSGFTWDLSAQAAKHQLGLSMTNSLSPSFGPSSQTSFQFGNLVQKEFNATLDLTYPVEVGLASPITFAGGLEYRRETYGQTAGDLQSYAAGPYASQRLYVQTAPGVYAFDSTVTMPPGASGYGGTSPASAGESSQNSYGVYASAEADVVEALTVGFAARFEHYDSFGDAVVGKANAIYHFTPTFAVRGTVGTGFHAPSPGQNNVQILTTNFVAGNQVQTGTYPVTSSIAQFYGAIPLQPARATNYGLGFVLNPSSNFTLTADGYIIFVRDRIGISRSFTVTPANITAQPALAAVGDGGVVNYFTNGFDTVTRGVDIVATYRTDLAGGPLNLTFAYNYNKSEVNRFDPTVISAAQITNVERLAPNHRANLSANWRLGDLTINARESFYGPWRAETDYPGQEFGSKFTTDIDITYTFADHYSVTVGANNLFNTYPDRIAPSASNPIFALTNSTADGQIYPRSGGPFGINGGFWYVRLGVTY